MTKWGWEVTCLIFSLLNVIGIPLLAATSIYLTSERARRVFGPFNFLIFSAVATSIGFAIILASALRPLLSGRAISLPHALVSVSICGRSALEDRSISSETLFLAGCGVDVSCFDRPGCWTAISYRWTGVAADTY